jgi:hypothetical protein
MGLTPCFIDRGKIMTQSQRAIHNFNYWYNWHGHWMYSTKEAAFKTWVERGVVDLDDAPVGIVFADLAR